MDKARAQFTGITNAKYEHIVTIDGDGQNDPRIY